MIHVCESAYLKRYMFHVIVRHFVFKFVYFSLEAVTAKPLQNSM